MKEIASYEAKSRFSKVLQEAAQGETFVITRNGVPMAELRPISLSATRRVRGSMKGKFGPMSADFNDLPAEFDDYQ